VIIGLQVVDYSNSPRAFKVCSHDYDLFICNFSIHSKEDVSTDRNVMSWSELYWMYFVIIKFPSQ